MNLVNPLKRKHGETMEQYDQRLEGMLLNHPRCQQGHIEKLAKRTTAKGRGSFLRGTLKRWHVESLHK